MRNTPGHLIPLRPSSADVEVDPRDFTAVVRVFRPYVAAVVMRMVGRDDDVDDIVQDTFLRALDGLQRLEDPGKTRWYLASIAVRLTLRKLKRRRALRVFGLAEKWHPTLLSTPRATGEHRALLASVYRVLDSMSADEQVAWSLRYLEGERLEDVAQLTGVSLSTVKRRIASVDAALGGADDE